MVAVILKTRNSTAGPMGYNENKVDKGIADRIAVRNLERNDRLTIENKFQQLRNGSRGDPQRVSFHMAFSPGEEDHISEEEMLKIIDGVMKELGFEKQPYAIYKHNDTPHPHYHVLSIRINEEGYRMDCLHDRLICNTALQELSKSYDFQVGKKRDENKKLKVSIALPVNRNHSNLIEQVAAAFDTALDYNFTTQAQFRQLLAMMNVEMMELADGGYDYLKFFALDDKGGRCSSMLDERDLMRDCMDDLQSRITRNSTTHPKMLKEKSRTANIIDSCFRYARSDEQFKLMLNNKGIAFIPSRNDKGEVFGGTFIDTTTKVCYKASEFSRVFKIAEYRSRVETGDWPGRLRDVRANAGPKVGDLVKKDMQDYNARRADLNDARQEADKIRDAIRNALKPKRGGMGITKGASGGEDKFRLMQMAMEMGITEDELEWMIENS